MTTTGPNPQRDHLAVLQAENARLVALLDAHGIEWRQLLERPGHHAFHLRQLSAGVAIVMDVVLLREADEWVVRIVGVSHE